jgi:hypothetical protein
MYGLDGLKWLHCGLDDAFNDFSDRSLYQNLDCHETPRCYASYKETDLHSSYGTEDTRYILV